MHSTRLALLIMLAVTPLRAEVFCVANPAALESALQTAAVNDEDDEIRIRAGTYGLPHPHQGYEYLGNQAEEFDVEISGDWWPFFGTSCAFQRNNPFSTILDGDDEWRLLRIDIDAEDSNVTVRLLSFINGTAPGNERGGGLEILVGPSGIIKVERNTFLLNTAYAGGGLKVTGGLLQQVTNNLFLANNGGISASAAELVGGHLGGIYFTNNTVISNTLDDVDPTRAALNAYSQVGVLLANNNFWDNDGHDASLPWIQGDDDLMHVVRNNNYRSISINGPRVVEDNIAVIPEYESGLFNYTPIRGSPLVDAGIEPPGTISFWYLTDVDLRGTDRVVGSAVDIGAYENDRIFGNGFDPSGPFGV